MKSREIDSQAAIAFDRLTVRYGKKLALDNISIMVPPGTVYALIGRNGAGKSSTVRCLLGQQKPNAGHASIFGKNSWRERTAAMLRVGVVPEEPNAPPEMTAPQIASFCASLYNKWNMKSVLARFERFGVPLNVPFGRLSKGQKGQVALALALGCEPALLILDDPTLGLDVVARKELFEELVGELADLGMSVFITTHDLAGVERIADRVGILKEGKLVINDELEILKSRFRRICYPNYDSEKQPQYHGELDKMNTVQVKVRGWGVEAVVADYDDSNSMHFRCNGINPEISTMSLEEIFTAVVGETKGE
ncbi:MAG: ABC transporter ATP-binding protein [Acidobacteriota bacterium]